MIVGKKKQKKNSNIKKPNNSCLCNGYLDNTMTLGAIVHSRQTLESLNVYFYWHSLILPSRVRITEIQLSDPPHSQYIKRLGTVKPNLKSTSI